MRRTWGTVLGGAVVEAVQGDVTFLLRRMAKGDPDAEAELFPLVYNELRRLARRYMRRERREHTLQPTALVHEVFLRMVGHTPVTWQNRTHFFAVTAQVMRRILVDQARARCRQKRGGANRAISPDEAILCSYENPDLVLLIHESLLRLALVDERQSRVVELRFFGGLTIEATAEVLGVSPKTIRRDWNHARAWLYGQLKNGHGHAA
jgi:RNA polymerase sigma-70 factor (ECF subfamily)